MSPPTFFLPALRQMEPRPQGSGKTSMSPPTFLLTFATYGQWLHGDSRGSVDRTHNAYGSPLVSPNQPLQARQRKAMTDEPYLLGDAHRPIVLHACIRHASLRGW